MRAVGGTKKGGLETGGIYPKDHRGEENYISPQLEGVPFLKGGKSRGKMKRATAKGNATADPGRGEKKNGGSVRIKGSPWSCVCRESIARLPSPEGEITVPLIQQSTFFRGGGSATASKEWTQTSGGEKASPTEGPRPTQDLDRQASARKEVL